MYLTMSYWTELVSWNWMARFETLMSSSMQGMAAEVRSPYLVDQDRLDLGYDPWVVAEELQANCWRRLRKVRKVAWTRAMAGEPYPRTSRSSKSRALLLARASS